MKHYGIHHGGPGIPGGMIHFAFKAPSPKALRDTREHLIDKGVNVTDVVDHGWCQSIYFKDPIHLQLEYCCLTQALDETHAADRSSSEWRDLART